MKKISLILAAIAACSMGIVSTACNDNPSPSPTPGSTDGVTSVKVTGAPTSLEVGKTAQLGVTVEVTGAAAKTVTWSVDKSGLASIDENGLVTAKGEGTVIVTARSTVDISKSDSVTISLFVNAAVKSVTISGAPTKMFVGENATLNATVDAVGSISKAVTWSSDKPGVIDVNSSGKITANALGTAVITAKSVGDESKFASVTIEVAKPEWTAAQSELMVECFGEEFPAFALPSGFDWTDDYFDTYGCLSAEKDGSDETSAINSAIKNCGGYTDLGIDDDDAHCYSAPLETNEDYIFYVQVYYVNDDTYGTYNSIDVYAIAKEYSEWPSEVIANHVSELGISVDVPAFDAGEEEFSYTVTYQEEYDDDDEPTGVEYVYVTAIGSFDSTIGAYDYVNGLNPSDWKVTEEEGVYYCRATDKQSTLIVYDQEIYYDIDWDTWTVVYAGGFELIICDYVPDYSLSINEQYEFIAVSENLTLTVARGDDIPAEATLTFSSSNETVATVSTEGVVNALSAGETEITVAYGEYASATTKVYVADSVPTAFTATQQEEIDKVVGATGIVVPFNKYIETVAYDTEEEVCAMDGKEISADLLFAYYDAFIDAGWEDAYEAYYTLYETYLGLSHEEAFAYIYSSTGCFAFAKSFNIGGVEHVINAVIFTSVEEEGDLYFSTAGGNLGVYVYDMYCYTYAEAVAAAEAIFTAKGETCPPIPTLTADRYYVNEDEDYNDCDFIAYGANLTLDQALAAFEALDYDIEIIEDEENGDYISGYAPDGETAVEIGVDGKDLICYFYFPVRSGYVKDISQLSDGCQVCFVTPDGYAIGEYNGKKNFASVDVYGEEDPSAVEGVTIFTLTDNGDGTWGLEDEDGNAYGADTGKNIKITGSGVDYNWEISIDSETYEATLTCNGWTLMYNSQYSVFKTYDASFEGELPVIWLCE